MKSIRKGAAAAVSAAFVFAPIAVFADAYYYSAQSGYSSYSQADYGISGACANLTRDLYRGARGSEVLQLQQFLISRKYPGGGAWMATGFFGAATEAAVRNFQGAQGVAVSGIVDGATRSAITRVSCEYGYAPSYSYPSYSSYPSNPLYPTYYGTGYGGCAFGVFSWQCPQEGQGGTPTVISLSPQSGAVGTSITVYGYGFSTTGNTVHFGNGIITGLVSPDGRGVSFTVPSQLSGYGSQTTSLGTYNLYVTNAQGVSSNIMPFVVTSLGVSSSSVPSILSLSPAQGRVGTQVVIRGSGFSAYDNTVRFGQGGTQHIPSFENGTVIYYTVPAYVSACDLVSVSGGVCGAPVTLVTTGSYSVSVSNPGSTSNQVAFIVQ